MIASPVNPSPAALSQEDQAGAPAGGIRPALDVTAGFKVVDEISHRLLRELRALRELG
jgi:hypothetical protein